MTAEIHSAMKCIEDAQQMLRRQYLSVEPTDPGYEEAVALTEPPAHLAPALWRLNAAWDHLHNHLASLDRRHV